MRTKSNQIELNFQLIVESAPNAIIVADPDGNIVFANTQAENLFGYGIGELIGRSIEVLAPSRFNIEHTELLYSFFLSSIEKVVGVTKGLFALKKDGTEFPAEISLNSIETTDGPLVLATVIDMTERKKAEEQQALLASIINSSEDAILSKTLDGIITSWNPGAERLFGYTAQEALGKNVSMLILPNRINEEPDIIEKIKRGGYVARYEAERMRKNGSAVFVSIIISPIKDKEGNIIGASKIARDISEKRKANETIEELNRHLEKKVTERTFQLENANKELEAFSYSVSHDLRAPVRAVNGYAKILEEEYGTKFDAEGKRLIGVITENAKTMGFLIDDLLAFSKLGRKEIRKTPVDMAQIANDVLQEINKITSHAAIVNIQPLHAVVADNAMMYRVFTNLLSNAIKYSSKTEKPVINIRSEEDDKEVVYSVEDNGVGFDMEYSDKLFGVFQRLHSSEEFEGTGVGLAIVKRIIAKHGGKVWAKAEVGKGATFYFSLPKEINKEK